MRRLLLLACFSIAVSSGVPCFASISYDAPSSGGGAGGSVDNQLPSGSSTYIQNSTGPQTGAVLSVTSGTFQDTLTAGSFKGNGNQIAIAVNGSSPTWTGQHTFDNQVTVSSTVVADDFKSNGSGSLQVISNGGPVVIRQVGGGDLIVASRTITFDGVQISTNNRLSLPLSGFRLVGNSTMVITNATATWNNMPLFDAMTSTAGNNFIVIELDLPGRLNTSWVPILRRFEVVPSSGNLGVAADNSVQAYVISLATAGANSYLDGLTFSNPIQFTTTGSLVAGGLRSKTDVTLTGWNTTLGAGATKLFIKIVRDGIADASVIQSIFKGGVLELALNP